MDICGFDAMARLSVYLNKIIAYIFIKWRYRIKYIFTYICNIIFMVYCNIWPNNMELCNICIIYLLLATFYWWTRRIIIYWFMYSSKSININTWWKISWLLFSLSFTRSSINYNILACWYRYATFNSTIKNAWWKFTWW